jgi:hypothetical protein
MRVIDDGESGTPRRRLFACRGPNSWIRFHPYLCCEREIYKKSAIYKHFGEALIGVGLSVFQFMYTIINDRFIVTSCF